MSKKSIIISIVILIIIVVGGLYWSLFMIKIKPCSGPNCGKSDIIQPFSLYRGETYKGGDKFEFRYPQDQLDFLGGQGSYGSQLIELQSLMGKSTMDSIQLWVTPNQTSLDNFISLMMKDTAFTETDTVVAGIPAKKLFVNAKLCETCKVIAEVTNIFLVSNNYGYRWIAKKNLESGLDLVPVLENILLSFKITK